MLSNTLAIISLFCEPMTLPRNQNVESAQRRLYFDADDTHQGINEARLRYQQANGALPDI